MSEFEEGLATGLLLADGGSGTIIQKTFTQNGTYHAIADAADGYDPVIVAVPIGSKSITKNGIYYAADDNLRGFDPVNVNVPMHWTFQPGETVPESMIPDSTIEDNAPETPDDVPYPTQEDPQRVIKPRFVYHQRYEDRPDVGTGAQTVYFGGYIVDTYTGDIISEGYTTILKLGGVKFDVASWELIHTSSTNYIEVKYRLSTFQPDVYQTRQIGIDCRVLPLNYTASSSSGQNTTTVSREE